MSLRQVLTFSEENKGNWLRKAKFSLVCEGGTSVIITRVFAINQIRGGRHKNMSEHRAQLKSTTDVC